MNSGIRRHDNDLITCVYQNTKVMSPVSMSYCVGTVWIHKNIIHNPRVTKLLWIYMRYDAALVV